MNTVLVKPSDGPAAPAQPGVPPHGFTLNASRLLGGLGQRIPGSYRNLSAVGAVIGDMTKHRVLFTFAVLALVAAGCGSSGSVAAGNPAATRQSTSQVVTHPPATRIARHRPPDAEMMAALRAWEAFPVDVRPRPLVLTSDPVSAPSGGFLTTDLKEAFLSGAFVDPAVFPAGPARAGGDPVVGARGALAVMRAEGSPANGAPAPPTPLRITMVRFGTAPFSTDRGTKSLPAWLFSFQGVQDPAAVLAVAASSRFNAPAGSTARESGAARLGRDGRTVTISFVGAAPGPGPCSADYAADQAASRTAVAVRVKMIRQNNGTVACSAVGYQRHITVTIHAPLGRRVLIDATTRGPVTTAA